MLVFGDKLIAQLDLPLFFLGADAIDGVFFTFLVTLVAIDDVFLGDIPPILHQKVFHVVLNLIHSDVFLMTLIQKAGHLGRQFGA